MSLMFLTIIGQATSNHRKLSFRVILLGVSIFSTIALYSCRTRQFIRTTPQMDIESRFWIRVLLLDDVTACTLNTASSLSVIGPQAQITQAHFDQTGMPIRVEISSGRIIVGGRPFVSDEVTVLPNEPYIFNLNGDDYRGNLRIEINSDGNSFDAINLVPLEPYLAGVVGAEMPDYWEPQALKAQAIAARTYCLYYKKRFGSNRMWDVGKTQASQVYLGVAAESPAVWEAIYKTYGKVLICRQPDGSEDIFPTYYSSTCGGHTENSKNVFGDSFEPLAGVPCPYCEGVAKLNIFFWPMTYFDKSYVTQKLLQRYPALSRLGQITNIIPAEQSNYGKFSRMTKVELVGSTGQKDSLRAEDLRLTIDPTGNRLRSTICQIINLPDKWAFSLGRGWGHGVGMCQSGAEGMARQGYTAEQILAHYYPGSKIISVY